MEYFIPNSVDTFTKDLMHSGFERTADSFASFVNSAVQVEKVEAFPFSITAGHYPETVDDEKLLVLKTELVGPIIGINYLLLTKGEANLICNHVFGADMIADNSSQFIVEFLKEMENVLAASTITAISDALKIDMYGDIPKIQAASGNELSSILNNEVGKISARVLINAHLNLPELGVSPQVWWFFNTSFEQLKGNQLMSA